MKPLSQPVIVADDEYPVVLPLISRLKEQYSVKYAASAGEAVSALQETQAPLIVLDYNFCDGQTGLDIVPCLRSIRPDLIIFLLTADEKVLACIGDAAVNRVMIKGMLTADLAQVAVDVDLALRPLKKVAAGKYADLVAQVADISPNSDDVKIYFEAWCAADERAERLESRKAELQAEVERLKRRADTAKIPDLGRQIKTIDSEVKNSRSFIAKKLVRSLCDSAVRGAVFTRLFRDDAHDLFRQDPEVCCQAFKTANEIGAGIKPLGETMQGRRDVLEAYVGRDDRLFHSICDGLFVFTHLWKKGSEPIFDGADESQMAFWTCRQSAASEPHAHAFDEYMAVMQGCYTLISDGKRIPVKTGEEYFIPRGILHGGEVLAGTRTIHAFGGHRANRVGA
jgi:DNA-binding NarL/FixJ family response regulator